ncbi:MAG TPA: hypothetical protein VIG79_16590, partial [Lapillicoccus sp.]|uniref:hypothetical protein n=1 Tax=Lapillicoccus sp. TaxID=1909287 RepID=UPI002F943567
VARPSVQWNGARVGALIGAVGGVLFVVLNAWPLGEPWTNVAIGIGVAWFLWDLRAIMRVPEDPDAVRPDARQMQAFWIVVALEVILIIGGTQLAIRVLEIPSASLPWVATVLGVHWLVFRMVFRQEVFLWLGCFTLTCGVVGLMVALTGVAGSDGLAATAIASGLIVGAVMLVAVGIDAGRRRESIIMRRARPRPPGRST